MKAFFVSIPHSGEKIAPETPWLLNLPEPIVMCDVDRFVNRLYSDAVRSIGVPLIQTEWHRYVIDLNRKTTDIDVDSVIGAKNPSGKFPQGLHWIRTTRMQPLMTVPMPMELHLRLIEKYFEPFQKEVQGVYSQFRKGGAQVVYHLDAHSMPSVGTKAHRDPGERRADIVVSDCNGKSCGPAYRDLVVASYKAAGFNVAVNWPYMGGGVTETYGRPDLGQEAIQVELNRSLYMNEETKQLNVDTAELVKQKIHTALNRLFNQLPEMK